MKNQTTVDNRQFYNDNAKSFYDSTIDVDMRTLYEQFLPLVPVGGHILDAGCGTGRDSKFFLDNGFQVTAIDASEQLARLATDLIGQRVDVCLFQNFKTNYKFDAIWACDSLLHVPLNELSIAFQKLSEPLNTNGLFYCSFKLGDDEITRNGRRFTNLNNSLLSNILDELPLKIESTWITGDLREGREQEQWLNALLRKK